MNWQALVDEARVIQWRRYLHQHAETAFKEVETTRYICEVLSAFPQLELLRPTETGVVAVLRGAKPGKVVALRADIDALPMVEEADVEFPSLNRGAMHACGHDAHTAMLLGAAQVLSQLQSELCGTVKFMFQPAEEQFPGGAKGLIESGVLDDVDCFFGEHIVANTPVDKLCCWPGPMTASPDQFTITIRGRGSHGASPEASIDPITIGAQLVCALNTIVSRNISPLDNAVVTVAKFTGGTSFNIIPPSAELSGTVRTFDPAIRARVRERMAALAEHTCAAYGAECTLDYIEGYDAVQNDPALVEIVHKVAGEVMGPDSLRRVRSLMAGDDYASYQKVAPVAFMLIGAGVEADGCGYQAHHPKFKLDERMLANGVKMFVGCTLEALSR